MKKSNRSEIKQFEGARKFLVRLGYPYNVSDEESQQILGRVLSNPALTKREIQILKERYLGDNARCTYLESGSRLGCTASNVRALEQNALRKIKHPESMPQRYIARLRLNKLIPTLEYDVLYDPSSIERKLGISKQDLSYGINQLTAEFDLARIQAIIPSGKRYIMRIGEQSENLPIPVEPSEHPCRNPLECLHLLPSEYLTEYMRIWERIVSRIKTLGYTSSKFDLGNHYPELLQKVYKDFVRDSMLPIAVYQDYRMGHREPSVIYHPKMIRQHRK
jgi:DNA-binding CsgD family transcriptional regulator